MELEDYIVVERRDGYVVAYSCNDEEICYTDAEEKALLIKDALNEYFRTP